MTNDRSSLSSTLVVIPAFNEEASIAEIIGELREKVPGIDFVVVDDGSSDSTRVTAASVGAPVLALPFNLGVGGALRLGFRYALHHGYSNVVQLDADGQHDPSQIPLLLDRLTDADLVIGARFAGEGDYEARGPRRWAMKVLATVISRVAGEKLTDTTSGFKAAGPRVVALFAREFPAEYLGDTVEALVIAARAGHKIVQVPVNMRVRTHGVPSQTPWKAAVFLGRVSLALVFALTRDRNVEVTAA